MEDDVGTKESTQSQRQQQSNSKIIIRCMLLVIGREIVVMARTLGCAESEMVDDRRFYATRGSSSIMCDDVMSDDNEPDRFGVCKRLI